MDSSYTTLWDRSPLRHHARLLGGKSHVKWTALDANSVDKTQCHMKKQENHDEAPSGPFKAGIPASLSKEEQNERVRGQAERAALNHR